MKRIIPGHGLTPSGPRDDAAQIVTPDGVKLEELKRANAAEDTLV